MLRFAQRRRVDVGFEEEVVASMPQLLFIDFRTAFSSSDAQREEGAGGGDRTLRRRLL
jgi:hypothetical protein